MHCRNSKRIETFSIMDAAQCCPNIRDRCDSRMFGHSPPNFEYSGFEYFTGTVCNPPIIFHHIYQKMEDLVVVDHVIMLERLGRRRWRNLA